MQPQEGAYLFRGSKQPEVAFIVLSVRGYSKWEKCVPSSSLVNCGLDAMDAIDCMRACAGAIQCVQMIGQLNGLCLGAEGAVAALK